MPRCKGASDLSLPEEPFAMLSGTKSVVADRSRKDQEAIREEKMVLATSFATKFFAIPTRLSTESLKL